MPTESTTERTAPLAVGWTERLVWPRSKARVPTVSVTLVRSRPVRMSAPPREVMAAALARRSVALAVPPLLNVSPP